MSDVGAVGREASVVTAQCRQVRGQILGLLTVGAVLGGGLAAAVTPLISNLPSELTRQVQIIYWVATPLCWLVLGGWLYLALRPVVQLVTLLQTARPVPPALWQRARLVAFTLPTRLLYVPVVLVFGLGLLSDLVGALFGGDYPLAQHFPGTVLATIVAAAVALILSVLTRRVLRPVFVLTADQAEDRSLRFSIRTRQLVTTLWLTGIAISFMGLLGYNLILKEARNTLQIKYTTLGQTIVRYVARGLNDEALIAYVETLTLEDEGFVFVLDEGGRQLTRVPAQYQALVGPTVEDPKRNTDAFLWDMTLVPLGREGRAWQLGFLYRVEPLRDPWVRRALVIVLAFTSGMLVFVSVITWYVTNELTQDLQEMTGRLWTLARSRQLTFERVKVLTLDEAGDLALAFNEIQGKFQELYQENETRRQEAAILAQVAQIVNSTLDLDQVLDRALEQLQRLVPYDSASILLVVEEGPDLMIAACAGFQNPAQLVGTRFTPQERNLGYEVMLSQRVQVIPDVQQQEEWGHKRDDVEGAHTIRSWIGAPLVVQGQSIGLLTLDGYQPGRYTEEDGRKAATFATQIAIAVQNARLYQTALARAQDLALLYEVSQQISGLLDTESLLYAIVHRVQAAFGYEVVSIHLLEASGTLRTAAHIGMTEEARRLCSQPGERGVVPWVADRGEPLLVPDVSRDERYVPSAPGVRSVLALPLLTGDVVMGVFNLESSRLNAFNADHIRLLLALSHQITVALENADLFASERAQATELARLAHTLAEEKRKLDAILRNVADGLIVTDAEANILLVNPAFERMFSCQADGVVGEPLYRVVTERDLHRLVVQALNDGDLPVTTEITLPDGRTLLASALSIQEERANGVVTVLRDVTHDKELDRMKSEFISAVSHELRTPLTSILGFAKLTRRALDRWLPEAVPVGPERALERMRRNLDIMVAEGERLTTLINDVLDIAALDAGRMEWHDQLFEMPVLIRRQVEAFRTEASEKGLLVRLDLEHHLPPLKGDPERIGQVVSNLLSNALKFTERGEIALVARFLPGGEPAGDWLTPPQGAVLISVSDTGIGMAPVAVAELFQRFHQGGDLLHNKPQGTGLGLAISREIVRHYGGEIWAESTLGVGSTFYFTLPLKEM